MNIVELFTKSNKALNDIVQQIRPEQLDLVMPEHAAYHQGQTLREHLNICAHENACVPRMLAAEENIPGNQEFTEDYLKDDYRANFARLTESANQAVLASTEEILNRTVHMSYADTSARGYLADITIQRSFAAIDIAQTAGISFAWPDEFVKPLLDHVTSVAPMLREYGVFPAEVTVAADASLQDKLIALMGRQP